MLTSLGDTTPDIYETNQTGRILKIANSLYEAMFAFLLLGLAGKVSTIHAFAWLSCFAAPGAFITLGVLGLITTILAVAFIIKLALEEKKKKSDFLNPCLLVLSSATIVTASALAVFCATLPSIVIPVMLFAFPLCFIASTIKNYYTQQPSGDKEELKKRKSIFIVKLISSSCFFLAPLITLALLTIPSLAVPPFLPLTFALFIPLGLISLIAVGFIGLIVYACCTSPRNNSNQTITVGPPNNAAFPAPSSFPNSTSSQFTPLLQNHETAKPRSGSSSPVVGPATQQQTDEGRTDAKRSLSLQL